jgi:hypothetical protein
MYYPRVRSHNFKAFGMPVKVTILSKPTIYFDDFLRDFDFVEIVRFSEVTIWRAFWAISANKIIKRENKFCY